MSRQVQIGSGRVLASGDSRVQVVVPQAEELGLKLREITRHVVQGDAVQGHTQVSHLLMRDGTVGRPHVLQGLATRRGPPRRRLRVRRCRGQRRPVEVGRKGSDVVKVAGVSDTHNRVHQDRVIGCVVVPLRVRCKSEVGCLVHRRLGQGLRYARSMLRVTDTRDNRRQPRQPRLPR